MHVNITEVRVYMYLYAENVLYQCVYIYIFSYYKFDMWIGI